MAGLCPESGKWTDGGWCPPTALHYQEPGNVCEWQVSDTSIFETEVALGAEALSWSTIFYTIDDFNLGFCNEDCIE